MTQLRNKRKRAFLICLLASALAAQNTQPSFENDQVIINAPHPNVEVPGSTHKAHDHKLNRVMVYMHRGGEFLHYLDGRTVDLKWQAGEVQWSPASGMHYSEVKPDTPPFTGPMIVDIGIKKGGVARKPANSASDALKVDPKHFKLEFENSQVRVLRVRLDPKESTSGVECTLNRLVVYITDADLRETSAAGKAEVVQRKAAEFRWIAPTKQKLENLSDQPFEAVIVEFRS
jgi:hypothetical protein